MTIDAVSHVFHELEKTSARLAITEQLAGLFAQATEEEIRPLCYLATGRLAPKFEGIEFQLAEKMMRRVLVMAYGVDTEDVLKDFKQKGDLGDVAYGLALSKVKSQKSKIHSKNQKIQAVYEKLLEIAQEEGQGSQERKVRMFSDLLSSVDPIFAKILVRIPIGALRLGFSDMTILDALSWMEKGDKSLRTELERAYNVSADIGRIAYVVKRGGVASLAKLKVIPGIPVRPQQSERLATAEEIIDKLGACAIEWKLDGFRAQIHVFGRTKNLKLKTKKLKTETQMRLDEKESDRTIQIFSRSLENTTHMFPEIVAQFQKLHVDSAILDGEAIGYDPKTGKHLPFQETIQRKRKYGISELSKTIPLRYYAFDLLELNGDSFLALPFKKRRRELEQLFLNNKKTLDAQTCTIAEQVAIADPAKLMRRFDQSVSMGFEGIMAKKLDAVYTAGARNFNWVKFKHTGEGKLADTLDCLVMGYYRGKGKRSGFGIGAFLVGVRQRTDNRQPTTDNYFVTICKIGTGLTDEQWRELKVQSDKFKVNTSPKEYNVPKELIPDVWIRPQIVVEIAADEITKSPLHTAGLALRFPRLMSFREDKSPEDATTLSEVEKLYQITGYRKSEVGDRI